MYNDGNLTCHVLYSTSCWQNLRVHFSLTMPLSDDGDDEHFVYPAPSSSDTREATPPHQTHPTPAQLESLYAAASSGDLTLLKRLFKNATETGDVQPFSLANDASSRTGFTALHAAASRGYLDMVTWREPFAFFPFSMGYSPCSSC